MGSGGQKMRENKDRRTQRRMMDVNSGCGEAHSCQAISIARSKVTLLYDGVTVISTSFTWKTVNVIVKSTIKPVVATVILGLRNSVALGTPVFGDAIPFQRKRALQVIDIKAKANAFILVTIFLTPFDSLPAQCAF